MTIDDIMNTTARAIAQAYTREEIENFRNTTSYSGMTEEEINNFIGNGDPSEWLDDSGEQVTAMVTQAIEYINHDTIECGREGITCEPAELAADLMLYAAWQNAED